MNISRCLESVASKMTYRLWIDDQSFDPETPNRHPPEGWKVAVSSAEAIELIDTLGPPSYISFDHDLGVLADGSEDTAIRVINYLGNSYYDAEIDYEVHSRNGPGSLNIISKMDSWKRSKTL